ncbi:MAG: hypothetical protein HY894_09410 [Deltaproteobacteria bacterium]|nr:hypothetical protein [Deltaproteobacteria bacterium]
MPANNERIKGVEAAAIILEGLGQELAASVARYLTAEELEPIGAALAGKDAASGESRRALAAELLVDASAQANAFDGAVFAKAVVAKAMGGDASEALLSRIMDGAEAVSAIRRAHAYAFKDALRDEHPAVIALALAHAQRERAAEFIIGLPAPLRVDVVRRIARLARASRGGLMEIARRLNPAPVRETDGGGAAAWIDIDGERAASGIMEAIADKAPDIAAHIKDVVGERRRD